MNNKYLKWALPFLFTSSILFILLKHISLSEIAEGLKRVPFTYIALGFLCHLSAYIFRAMILYLFLKEENVSYLYLLSAHFVHNLYSHIIPASLGELAFPFLVKGKVNMSKSFAGIMILRLITVLLTVMLFAFSLFFMTEINIFNFKSELITFSLLSLVVSGIIIILFRFRKWIVLRINSVQFLSGIYKKVRNVFPDISRELVKLREPLFLFKVLVLNLLSIIGIVLFYMTILKGLNIDLNLFQIIFVSSIGLLFLVIPVKSIGGFGTTEGAWAIGLMILGFSKGTSIQSGFIIHIYALLNVVILFLLGTIYRYYNGLNKTSLKIIK